MRIVNVLSRVLISFNFIVQILFIYFHILSKDEHYNLNINQNKTVIQEITIMYINNYYKDFTQIYKNCK